MTNVDTQEEIISRDVEKIINAHDAAGEPVRICPVENLSRFDRPQDWYFTARRGPHLYSFPCVTEDGAAYRRARIIEELTKREIVVQGPEDMAKNPAHQPQLVDGDIAATPSNHGDNYFGACPECGKHDGYVNVGRNHIFICREHRTGWCIGSNLFSSWQDQTPAQQAEVERMLEDYREVEPVYADRGSDPDATAMLAHAAHLRREAQRYLDEAADIDREYGPSSPSMKAERRALDDDIAF